MINKNEAKRVLNLLKELNIIEAQKESGSDWPDDIIDNVSDKFLAGLLRSKVNECYNSSGNHELLLEDLKEICNDYGK